MKEARETSAVTYQDILSSGILSMRRAQVFSVLAEKGPLTGDVLSSLVKEKYGSWCHSETVRNRLTELRDMDAVYEVGTVQSPLNGRDVILWQVTGRMPKEMPNRETRTEKIKRLEKRIKELENQLVDRRA